MSDNNMRQMAASTVADCDCLDAALRDGKSLAESRELLHGLVDVSDAAQLRMFLGVVRFTAEAMLRKQTDSP